MGVWKRRSGGAKGMSRATPSSILGALAPVGGARWAGKVVWGVGGTHLDEKSGSPKIAKKSIKRRKKVAGRPKSVSVEIFLGSMDPGLSFDVYYGSRDPLVAALEFLKIEKFGENRSKIGWWEVPDLRGVVDRKSFFRDFSRLGLGNAVNLSGMAGNGVWGPPRKFGGLGCPPSGGS